MEGLTVSLMKAPDLTNAASKAKENAAPVEKVDNNTADEWKNIRKARLSRKVMEDPELAAKLMVAKASPVYNSSGQIIQAVSTQSFDV